MTAWITRALRNPPDEDRNLTYVELRAIPNSKQTNISGMLGAL
jgi:hypothetical protein